jgi:hypothetical protein
MERTVRIELTTYRLTRRRRPSAVGEISGLSETGSVIFSGFGGQVWTRDRHSSARLPEGSSG